MESICFQLFLLVQSLFQFTKLLIYSKLQFICAIYCNATGHLDVRFWDALPENKKCVPYLTPERTTFVSTKSQKENHSVLKLLTGLVSALLMAW